MANLLQWNARTGCYEGVSADGRYHVSVDGDEMAEARTAAGEASDADMLAVDAWLECAGNPGIEVVEIPPRRPGRPRIHQEPRGDVRVALPVDLIAAIDAATSNRTAFIERAIRAALASEPPAE